MAWPLRIGLLVFALLGAGGALASPVVPSDDIDARSSAAQRIEAHVRAQHLDPPGGTAGTLWGLFAPSSSAALRTFRSMIGEAVEARPADFETLFGWHRGSNDARIQRYFQGLLTARMTRGEFASNSAEMQKLFALKAPDLTREQHGLPSGATAAALDRIGTWTGLSQAEAIDAAELIPLPDALGHLSETEGSVGRTGERVEILGLGPQFLTDRQIAALEAVRARVRELLFRNSSGSGHWFLLMRPDPQRAERKAAIDEQFITPIRATNPADVSLLLESVHENREAFLYRIVVQEIVAALSLPEATRSINAASMDRLRALHRSLDLFLKNLEVALLKQHRLQGQQESKRDDIRAEAAIRMAQEALIADIGANREQARAFFAWLKGEPEPLERRPRKPRAAAKEAAPAGPAPEILEKERRIEILAAEISEEISRGPTESPRTVQGVSEILNLRGEIELLRAREEWKLTPEERKLVERFFENLPSTTTGDVRNAVIDVHERDPERTVTALRKALFLVFAENRGDPNFFRLLLARFGPIDFEFFITLKDFSYMARRRFGRHKVLQVMDQLIFVEDLKFAKLLAIAREEAGRKNLLWPAALLNATLFRDGGRTERSAGGADPANGAPVRSQLRTRGERVGPVEPAVVRVAGGSGFFVSPNGLLLTSAHVVRGTDPVRGVEVRIDPKAVGKTAGAEIVVRAELLVEAAGDVALLKVDPKAAGLEAAPFIPVSAREPKLGERVVTIGFPGYAGLAETKPKRAAVLDAHRPMEVHAGVVRSAPSSADFFDLFPFGLFTTAHGRKGSSGGPIVAGREAIGIQNFGADAALEESGGSSFRTLERETRLVSGLRTLAGASGDFKAVAQREIRLTPEGERNLELQRIFRARVESERSTGALEWRNLVGFLGRATAAGRVPARRERLDELVGRAFAELGLPPSREVASSISGWLLAAGREPAMEMPEHLRAWLSKVTRAETAAVRTRAVTRTGRAIGGDAAAFPLGSYGEKWLEYLLTQDPMRLRKLTLGELANEMRDVYAPMFVGNAVGSGAARALRLKGLPAKAIPFYLGLLAVEVAHGSVDWKRQPVTMAKLVAASVAVDRLFTLFRTMRTGVHAASGVTAAASTAAAPIAPPLAFLGLVLRQGLTFAALSALNEAETGAIELLSRAQAEDKLIRALSGFDDLIFGKGTSATVEEIAAAKSAVEGAVAQYEAVLRAASPAGKAEAEYESELKKLNDRLSEALAKHPGDVKAIRAQYAMKIEDLEKAYRDRLAQVARPAPAFDIPLPPGVRIPYETRRQLGLPSMDVVSGHQRTFSWRGYVLPRLATAERGDPAGIVARFLRSRILAAGAIASKTHP